MVKKLYLLMIMFVLMFSSSYAHENATFFSQTPILQNWDSNLGTGNVYFDVGSDNVNLIDVKIDMIHDTLGVLTSTDVLGLGGRDEVNYTFDLSLIGDYNGDYNIIVTVYNQEDYTQFEENSDVIFTYSMGVDYVEESENRFEGLNTFVGEIFETIGITLSETVNLLLGEMLLLLISVVFITGFVGIIYAVMRFVENPMKLNIKK